jgi:hypothetical protein
MACNREPERQVQAVDVNIWFLSDTDVWSRSEGRDQVGTSFVFDRPASGVVLADGRAVVGNRDQLVFMGSDGKVDAVAARAGSGPYEFSRVHALFPTVTGVAAYDLDRRKLLLYGNDALPRAEIRLPQSLAGEVVGVDSLTNIVVWDRGGTLEDERLRLVFPDGRISQAFGSWSRARRIAVPVIVSDLQFTIRHQIGCTATNLAAVIGQAVFVAEQATGTVFAITPGGQQRSVYQLPERRIDAQFARRMVQVPVGSQAGSQRVASGVLESFGRLGDPFPYAWDRLLADPSGLLWLRRVECAVASGERSWDIVDTAGGLRAQLRTWNTEILGIHGRYVLALAADGAIVSLLTIRGN